LMECHYLRRIYLSVIVPRNQHVSASEASQMDPAAHLVSRSKRRLRRDMAPDIKLRAYRLYPEPRLRDNLSQFYRYSAGSRGPWFITRHKKDIPGCPFHSTLGLKERSAGSTLKDFDIERQGKKVA
jgi:hypothetical protein